MKICPLTKDRLKEIREKQALRTPEEIEADLEFLRYTKARRMKERKQIQTGEDAETE